MKRSSAYGLFVCAAMLVLFAAMLGAPSPGHAQIYAGQWEGMTAQDKDIAFTVSGSSITALSFDGAVSGPGCTANVTSTSSLSAPINGSSFSFSGGSSAPGAVSFTISGTFGYSITTASGTLNMTLHSIPGVPTSCSGSASTTWSATREGGAPEPPQLSIDDVTVTEGDNGITPAIFPVHLSSAAAAPVTVDYVTNNGTAAGGNDFLHTSGTLTFSPGQTMKMVAVDVLGDTEDEGNETFFVDLSNPTNATLADGRGRATILDDDDTAPPSDCVENDTTLCLVGDRFQLILTFTTAQSTGAGRAVPYTNSSGFFWFFSDDNLEVMVKVLNACSLNNRYWVFSAATTDVEYNLVVTDTRSGLSKTYHNDAGQPAPAVTDTQAFATCP